jgi:ABC-type thiamin/hydroxymethylpyrimidine transport system permease subunit
MFATLFLFGYLVFQYRRRSVLTRILGGLATALAGMIVIGVELVVRYIH